MSSLFTWRVVDTGIGDKVRDARGRFQFANQAAKRANAESVEWLGRTAAAYLESRTHRDPDERNKRRLADVIADPAASKVTVDGFDFLVHERIAKLSRRTARFYRAIEGRPGEVIGSSIWVGRRIRLAWSGPSAPPHQAARFRREAPTVLITKGVPAYHYAQHAVDLFTTRNVWMDLLNKQLGGRKIEARAGR